MGITEFITLILVYLKVNDKIDWSWYGVFALEAVALLFYAVIIIFQLVMMFGIGRRAMKDF